MTAQTSGSWSDPSIWSTHAIPTLDARVSIPEGIIVTYDRNSDAEIDCIEIASLGELRWVTVQDTRLRITNLQVLPSGIVTIGSAVDPVDSNHRAEIIIRDIPLDVNGNDPSQYGNGLHIFGTFTVHGAKKSLSYLRFANEALAGDTSLDLEEAPIGWKSGDRLLIPDTRQIPFRKKHKYFSQAEEPIVQTIVGSTVTLTSPLQFDHSGPRDANGQVGPTEMGDASSHGKSLKKCEYPINASG